MRTRSWVRVCLWVPGRMSVCVRIRACSLADTARYAYAPYCDIICCPSSFTIFFDIFSYTVQFSEKSYWTQNVCFGFIYNSVQNIYNSKENLVRYRQKCRKRLHEKYPLLLSDFNENSIFQTDFRKKLKYQVLTKLVQWEPSCSMRTDGHEDNSHFLRLCERV
jgi:hypothetical protein